jgi:hypothetical protein
MKRFPLSFGPFIRLLHQVPSSGRNADPAGGPAIIRSVPGPTGRKAGDDLSGSFNHVDKPTKSPALH